VGVGLGKGAVLAALGITARRLEAHNNGLTLWPAALLDANIAERDRLGALLDLPQSKYTLGSVDIQARWEQLSAAIVTQNHVLGVRATNEAIRTALVPQDEHAGGVPSAGQIMTALGIAVGGMVHVRALAFHCPRKAAARKAKSARRRLIDRTVDNVVRFVSDSNSHATNGNADLPIVVLGDWAIDGKGSKGKFAMKEFVSKLAKRVIVVAANEHCTSKLCGDCGHQLAHPIKGSGKSEQHDGVVYCKNKLCASRGRFFNRDVNGATNICNRWLYDYVMGGSLGVFYAINSILVFFCAHFFFMFWTYYTVGWFSETESRAQHTTQPAQDRHLSFFWTFTPVDASVVAASLARTGAEAEVVAAAAASAASPVAMRTE
jgi:hypothetical protein